MIICVKRKTGIIFFIDTNRYVKNFLIYKGAHQSSNSRQIS